MIKKIICILLTLSALTMHMTAGAATEATNMDGYIVLSGDGKIKNFTNAIKSPFTEDYINVSYMASMSGITAIGNNAFKGCSMLRDIVLPSTVHTIGSQAFADCISITKVVIPYGVTNIMNYAFAGCSSLQEVYIPDSVTMIGESAFYGCNNLTIYASESSCAKKYCADENINFQPPGKAHNIISDVLGDVKIIINGNELSYKYPVVMRNSSTLIPLRSIFEATGCKVTWDDSTKTAYASKNGITVGLKTESDIAVVNGQEKKLATSTTLMCDNTMVHIRAVEHLGMNVDWDGDTRTITITY